MFRWRTRSQFHFSNLAIDSEVKNDYLINKNTTPSIVLTVLGDLRDNIYAHSLWVRIVNSKKSKEKGAGRFGGSGTEQPKLNFCLFSIITQVPLNLKGWPLVSFGLLLLTPRNLAIICSLNRRYMQIIKRGNANLEWKRVHYGKIAFDNVLVLLQYSVLRDHDCIIKNYWYIRQLITCDKRFITSK